MSGNEYRRPLREGLSGAARLRKRLRVADSLRNSAFPKEADKLLDDEAVNRKGSAERPSNKKNGIVFLDEIDKVNRAIGRAGGGRVPERASSAIFLPLIEGTTGSRRNTGR